MTSTKKNNTAQSPVEKAHAVVEEVRRSLTEAEASLAELVSERDAISDQVARGSLVADTERLAELTDTLVPRKSDHVGYLRGTALVVAETNLHSQELRDLAADASTGVAAKRAAYVEKRDAATAKLAEAITDLRNAADEWNSVIQPIQLRAFRAGLTTNTGDPFAYVLAQVDHEGRPLGRVEIGDEVYAPVTPDRVVGAAVRETDQYLGRYVARGQEQDYLGQPWR